MDSRNETGLQDYTVTTTQLSASSTSEKSNENSKINDCWNVLNARFSFYGSKKISKYLFSLDLNCSWLESTLSYFSESFEKVHTNLNNIL